MSIADKCKDKCKAVSTEVRNSKWAFVLVLVGAATYFVGGRLENLPVPVDTWGALSFLAGAVQLWADSQKKRSIEEVSKRVGGVASHSVSEIKDAVNELKNQFGLHRREVTTQHETMRQTMQLIIQKDGSDNERHLQHESRLNRLEQGQTQLLSEVKKLTDKMGV